LKFGSDQVTADAQIGRTLSQRDAAEQAALQRQTAEAVAHAQDEKAKSDRAAAEESAASKPTGDSRLAELKKREALLEMLLRRLREDWKDLPQKNTKTSRNAYALNQQIREVERELFEVRQQEKLVRLESH
jgi:hypothetical protein